MEEYFEITKFAEGSANISEFYKLSEGFGKPKRKRIKDRGIKWEEKYRERSEPLKKRFDKSLGSGSYYRWEGHDFSTNSDYFIVIGPAKEKTGKKAYFAGIKKLPIDWEHKKVFSPYGKYFSNILSALSYANSHWGIRFPPNQRNYSIRELAPIDIPRKIKG